MDFKAIKNIFRKKDETIITKVNIKWKGKMHQMEGFTVKEKTFDITIPFENKNSGVFAIPGLKLQKKEDETIKTIEISDPLKVIKVDPQVPFILKPGEKANIKVTIERPDYAYDGPITITMGTEAPNAIKIEISKQVIKYNGVSVEIPNTAEIMSTEKSNIFKKEIQLLKAVTYGSEVKGISANKPFNLVSTDPKLPFKVDDTNSFIVAFYIQAPDFSYAGPLELEVV
jgi:hypothetical protein